MRFINRRHHDYSSTDVNYTYQTLLLHILSADKDVSGRVIPQPLPHLQGVDTLTPAEYNAVQYKTHAFIKKLDLFNCCRELAILDAAGCGGGGVLACITL